MKKFLPARLLVGMLLLVFGAGLWQCGNSGITLTATNCLKDSIRITESTRITPQGGEQWQLSTVITVYCGSSPISGAEVEVKFWWPNGDLKFTTDANGQIPYRKQGHGSKPSGESFEVRVVGSDGERPEVFTIP